MVEKHCGHNCSCISIRGSYNSRRPVGEPGPPPRGSFTTISYGRFLKPDSNYARVPFHQPQRIQRENRSNKRGLRSEAALIQRKCNKQAKRSVHRRQYRWCRSNIRVLADEMLEGRLGTCAHATVKTTQSPQPFKYARKCRSARLYEEHRNQNKADLAAYKLPYASTITTVSLNTRSLLKPTMHKQIIDYTRANNAHVLCLQETKSKTTTQYVVDNYTFMTISAAENQKQEHAGVGFVFCPQARAALLRTQLVHSRLASVTLLLQAGELSIVNAHVPHARPEGEGHDLFEQLQHLVDKVNRRKELLQLLEISTPNSMAD